MRIKYDRINLMRVRLVLGHQRERRLYLCAGTLVVVTLFLVNVMVLYGAVPMVPDLDNGVQRANYGVGPQGGITQLTAVPHGPEAEQALGDVAGFRLQPEALNDRALSDAGSSTTRVGVFLPLLGLKPSKNAVGAQQRREIEKLAIQSWRLTAEALHDISFEAHVYGTVEEGAHCDPAWDSRTAGPHFTCLVLSTRCLHPGYANTPTVDCILATMATTTTREQYDYVVLANGDLLFSPRAFAASMLSVVTWIKDSTASGIVLVGQRTDTTWDEFWKPEAGIKGDRQHLPLDAYASLHENARAPSRGARRHPDFGVDYFAMSARLVPTDFPRFLVGRFRWDNVLLARFLTKGGRVAVVDATAALPVLHLGGMYSSDPEYHYDRFGAQYNDALANECSGESYKLGRIHNAAWLLEEVRTSAERRPAYVVKPRLSQDRPDYALLVAISRAGNGPLLLLAVLPHELMHALEWLRETQRASWFYAHYLFVTLDQETYDAIEAAAPGRVILEDMTGWPRSPLALGWKSFEQLLKLRSMPVAILSATTLRDIGQQETDLLVTYAEKTNACDATLLQDSNELLSVQPQTQGGMTFWQHYKAQGGKNWLDKGKAVCWI
jgi:hypothetical protein